MATPSNSIPLPNNPTVVGAINNAPLPAKPTSAPMRPLRTADNQSMSRDPLLAGPLPQSVQQEAQSRLPFRPNNGNPRGANNMPRYPVPQAPSSQAYYNALSGQQSNLGRYRPPTLAGDGNNPLNWNDYGGYSYNLPNAFGPTPQRGVGPYGGYPSYLQPNWMNLLPGGG